MSPAVVFNYIFANFGTEIFLFYVHSWAEFNYFCIQKCISGGADRVIYAPIVNNNW